MDVTPRELREIDFRTEWKGYHRDDVDDLLERAAATIEAQNERVRQLAERADAARAEVANPPTRETEEMLRRTLVLAQRTADEAVAEAQVEARRLTEEAEARARAVVGEAETNARRVAEGERQRLEAEVVDLGARREALLADVDQLERFANEYRTRLRSAIERDLDTLVARAPVTETPRPTLHEVDVPPGGAGAPRPAPTAEPARPAAPPRPVAPPVGPTPTPHPSQTRHPSEPGSQASAPPLAPAPPPVVPLGPESRTIELDRMAPFPDPAVSPPGASRPGEPGVAPEEAVDAEVLDDDAFFASLREAVRDDSPLGPRGDDPEIYVDDGTDSGRFGNMFKRRR